MTPEVRPALLRTERLVLRPFLDGDAPDIYAYAQLEEWSRYHLPSIPFPYALEDAETFIASMLDKPWETEPNWAIVLDRRVIGGLGLTLRPPEQLAELGYSLAPAHWNRGLTTEAARGALDYAFYVLGLEAIVARCDARNTGSWRVMEKLGMWRTALETGVRLDRAGEQVDEVHYRIERTSWLS